jgi:hypothetical protein
VVAAYVRTLILQYCHNPSDCCELLTSFPLFDIFRNCTLHLFLSSVELFSLPQDLKPAYILYSCEYMSLKLGMQVLFSGPCVIYARRFKPKSHCAAIPSAPCGCFKLASSRHHTLSCRESIAVNGQFLRDYPRRRKRLRMRLLL